MHKEEAAPTLNLPFAPHSNPPKHQIWTVTPTTKPKTYTFYYVGDRVSAARSSAGGLSLLLK